MAAWASLSVAMHHNVWFSGDSGPIHIVGRAGSENSGRGNHDATAGEGREGRQTGAGPRWALSA